MQRKLLKTTLFGFSKTEVCEYIARVNDEFNSKLDAVNGVHTKEKNELLFKIANLEEELGKYKQANSDIAQALFDAQQYTSATDELRMLKDAETGKLNGYRDSIEKLRKEIASLLSEISGKMADAEAETENLAAEYSSEEGIAV